MGAGSGQFVAWRDAVRQQTCSEGSHADVSRELFNLEERKGQLLVFILKQGLLDRTDAVCVCVRGAGSAKRIEEQVETNAKIRVLPSTSCMALSILLHFSQPQFSLL